MSAIALRTPPARSACRLTRSIHRGVEVELWSESLLPLGLTAMGQSISTLWGQSEREGSERELARGERSERGIARSPSRFDTAAVGVAVPRPVTGDPLQSADSVCLARGGQKQQRGSSVVRDLLMRSLRRRELPLLCNRSCSLATAETRTLAFLWRFLVLWFARKPSSTQLSPPRTASDRLRGKSSRLIRFASTAGV